jgi:hypothetical protein
VVCPCLFFSLQKVSNIKFVRWDAGWKSLGSVDNGVLSTTGMLALDTEMRGSFDSWDCIFGISGGNLSHPSSILSKWSTVDWVRAYVQLDIKEKEALLACM